MSTPFEVAIFDLLAALAPGKSVCPTDVAKRVDPDHWRRRLGQVRTEAVQLAKAGRLLITRHNKPVDPDHFRGVYRLKLPPAEDGPPL